MSAIQHMNGFELAGQQLKVGKASFSAITINLAVSSDKVVRGGSSFAPQLHPTSVTTTVIKQKEDQQTLAHEEDIQISSSSRRELMQKLSRQSRCLLLLNLVAKGEVDEELQEEVTIECGNFGKVSRVEIKELEDHVRVFVVFEEPDSAAKAQKALHGRFFGGNQVEATFFELNKLESGEFASSAL
jgi:hypothetical protein